MVWTDALQGIVYTGGIIAMLAIVSGELTKLFVDLFYFFYPSIA